MSLLSDLKTCSVNKQTQLHQHHTQPKEQQITLTPLLTPYFIRQNGQAHIPLQLLTSYKPTDRNYQTSLHDWEGRHATLLLNNSRFLLLFDPGWQCLYRTFGNLHTNHGHSLTRRGFPYLIAVVKRPPGHVETTPSTLSPSVASPPVGTIALPPVRVLPTSR